MVFRFLALLLPLLCVSPAPLAADQPEQPNQSDLERVESRAQQYFEALKLQDLLTAYQMEEGAVRETLTASQYRSSMMSAPSVLVDYEIKSVSMVEGKAQVDLTASYRYPQLREPLPMPRTQYWVMIDDEWYRASDQGSVNKLRVTR